MENKEEQIKDIKIQEGTTYGFIGGLAFLGTMVFTAGQEATVLMDAILAGGAAAVFSVAISYLTIGKYFAAKRQKINQIGEMEVSRENTLVEPEKTKTESLANEERFLNVMSQENLDKISNDQTLIRKRKKY